MYISIRDDALHARLNPVSITSLQRFVLSLSDYLLFRVSVVLLSCLLACFLCDAVLQFLGAERTEHGGGLWGLFC